MNRSVIIPLSTMLDPWIIEEILKREKTQRDQENTVELPIEQRPEIDQPMVTPPPDNSERGVVEINVPS